MDDDSQARIPLRARDGSVRDYALVDAEDFAELNEWRWCLGNGYARRIQTVDGKRRAVLMHRQLLGLTHGDGLEGDHINRNRLDNRRENLRVVNHSQNAHNRPSYPGTSPYRNVYWSERTRNWRVHLEVDGQKITFGPYENAGLANMIAQQARVRYMSHAVD